MNSHQPISFSTSVIGASHITGGKPCQDSSLSYDDSAIGLHVAIVSDGHGGATYVRSDRGSRIAARIALEKVREFVANPETAALFRDRRGAVTTVATDLNQYDTLLHNSAPQERQFLGQSDQDKYEQNQAYRQQVEGNEDIEKAMRTLFHSIVVQWILDIEQDAQEEPLNEHERQLLGGKDIKKAYGATLLVAVSMPTYRFAFQLGDGKIFVYRADMTWDQPVPWDYKCFLNLTTSLCQSDSIPDFRYAFDGTDDPTRRPVAVILGSDGIDDTWQTDELMESAYTNIVRNLTEEGVEQTIGDLHDKILPEWSKHGSHDDMSIAGIIDLTAAKMMTEIWDNQRRLKAANDDREKCDKEIIYHNAVIEETKEILRSNTAKMKQSEEEIKRFTANLNALQETIQSIEEKIEQQKNELRTKLEDIAPEQLQPEAENTEQEPATEPEPNPEVVEPEQVAETETPPEPAVEQSEPKVSEVTEQPTETVPEETKPEVNATPPYIPAPIHSEQPPTGTNEPRMRE